MDRHLYETLQCFAEQDTKQFIVRMDSVAVSLWVSPVAQAEADLLANFPDAHAFGDQQFAGQGGPFLSPFTHVVGHATVLTILIPAETAVRDWFRGEVLETTKQRIVLGNLDFSAEKFDGD